LLAGVVAAAGVRHGFRGADGLGVHHRRGRVRVTAVGLADACAQSVMDAGQGAVAGPGPKVVVDGGPGWEVDRQRSPHDAVVVDVADGVDDVAAWVAHRTPTPAGGAADRHQPGDDLPLLIGGVRGVATRTRGGQMLANRYRAGACAGTSDKVETHAGSLRSITVSSPVLVPDDPVSCQRDTPYPKGKIDRRICPGRAHRFFNRLSGRRGVFWVEALQGKESVGGGDEG